jgi:hypothetical protein
MDNLHPRDMSEPLIESQEVEFGGCLYPCDKTGERVVRLTVWEMYARGRWQLFVYSVVGSVIGQICVFGMQWAYDYDPDTWIAVAWYMINMQVVVQAVLYVAYRGLREEMEISEISRVELTLSPC